MNRSEHILPRPESHLGLCIVIPCHNEPELIGTLESLWSCERSQCLTEVIVIINDSESSTDLIKKQNELTLSSALNWAQDHQDSQLRFHILYYPNLPKKYAGVGLARKIGMDLAAERLLECGQGQAPIICLDADCLCESNYLQVLEAYFSRHSESHAATIYYEHPLEGNLSEDVYQGIINYELFLRYYVHGLKWSGSPYGIQTVGSSMAVRVDIYNKQGGMNRRKAGEDFYFLQKLVTLGPIPEINNTMVYPSPRASDRVPFGTGQAINKWLDNPGEYLTYQPIVFKDLKGLFQLIPEFYDGSEESMRSLLAKLSPILQEYLAGQSVEAKVREIKGNSTSYSSFRKRFWFWFNGFQAMKFIHFARDHEYPNISILKAVNQFLDWQGVSSFGTPLEQLYFFRKLDKTIQKN